MSEKSQKEHGYRGQHHINNYLLNSLFPLNMARKGPKRTRPDNSLSPHPRKKPVTRKSTTSLSTSESRGSADPGTAPAGPISTPVPSISPPAIMGGESTSPTNA